MIQLNQDYADIKNQIEYLMNLDQKSYSKIENLKNKSTYQVLAGVYLLMANDESCFRMPIGLLGQIPLFIEEQRLHTQFHRNFLKNQSFHQQMVKSSLEILNPILEEDWSSNKKYNLDCLDKNEEETDLLYSFFKEVNPSLKDIFEDIVKQKHLYASNETYQNSFLIHNTAQKTLNIFIYDQGNFLIKLDSIIHELGHAWDCFKLDEKKPSELKSLYFYQSIYTEVFSFMYEEQFLEYLIENHKYQEEAKFYLQSLWRAYYNSLYDLHLYTELPSRKYHKIIHNSYPRSYVSSLTATSSWENIEDYDFIEPMKNCIRYSYGFLLGNFLIEHPEKRQQFFKIHYDLFQPQKLEECGMGKEEINKCLTKKFDTYFE